MEGDAAENQGVGLAAISTHALTWRATVAQEVNVLAKLFLPTPSHGGRQYRQRLSERHRRISTHALTWRATLLREILRGSPLGISTHALTWRATQQSYSVTKVIQFLPTPSHGGRPHQLGGNKRKQNFYPRPHMEGDRI